MILLLNYIPTILLVIAIGATGLGVYYNYTYEKNGKKLRYILYVYVVLALIAITLRAINPSYMPKGTVPTVPIVSPEPKTLPPIEDRTKQPELSKEERDKHFNKLFESVTPG